MATRQLIRAQRRAILVVSVEAADELARIGRQQLVDARCPEQIGRGVVREHETPAAVLHRDGLAEVAEDRVQALLGGLELLRHAGVVQRQCRAPRQYAQELRVVGAEASAVDGQRADLASPGAQFRGQERGRVVRWLAVLCDADQLGAPPRVDRRERHDARDQQLGHALDGLVERRAGRGQVGQRGEHALLAQRALRASAQAGRLDREQVAEDRDAQLDQVVGRAEVVVPERADRAQHECQDGDGDRDPDVDQDGSDERAQHEAARDLHLVEGDVDGRERKGDGDGERRAARGAPSH